MSNRRWEIYTLSDPRTDQVRYVGVTFRGKIRFNEHISKAIKGGKSHRDCWIRSLVSASVRPDYLVVEIGCGDGWQDRERHWIAAYRLTADLTNCTDGGEGLPGYVPTAELRAKWSAMRAGVKYASGRVPAMLGRKHSAEARRKIGSAGQGRKLSPQTKGRMSTAAKRRGVSQSTIEASIAARQGKPLTEDHRRKIAATTKNRKPVLCVETGQTYESITLVARLLGVKEASVYQAIRKGCRCAGYHFRLA